MAESIKSKIARCEHTADTYERVRAKFLKMAKMARNGKAKKYEQFAEDALRRIKSCRSIAARLRKEL